MNEIAKVHTVRDDLAYYYFSNEIIIRFYKNNLKFLFNF
jgi:hypothetical protein